MTDRTITRCSTAIMTDATQTSEELAAMCAGEPVDCGCVRGGCRFCLAGGRETPADDLDAHESPQSVPNLVSGADAIEWHARAETAEAKVARVQALLDAPRFVDETVVDLADLRAALGQP